MKIAHSQLILLLGIFLFTQMVDYWRHNSLFTHMVEQKTYDLSDILKAASDPTRRAILTLLAQQGPSRVTDLAAHFEMSLNSVSKHIKVLETAGLVTRKTLGRVHMIEVNVTPIQEVDVWFSQLRSIWAMRLDALENLLTEENENDPTK